MEKERKKKEDKRKIRENGNEMEKRISSTRTLSPLPFCHRSSSFSLSPWHGGTCTRKCKHRRIPGIEPTRQKIDSSLREPGDSISNQSGRGAVQNRKWPGFSPLARTYSVQLCNLVPRDLRNPGFFWKFLIYFTRWRRATIILLQVCSIERILN